MNSKKKTPRRLVTFVMTCLACSGCGRESLPSSVSDTQHAAPLRLALSADDTSGTVPLTVNFTGKLLGPIDTLVVRVPPITLAGGYNPEEEIYVPVPDTTTPAKKTYSAREHYFRQATYRAVMRVHALSGDIVSDTVVITVH
jgi:hypothetical protein